MNKFSKLKLLPILMLLLTSIMACSSDSVTNSGSENEVITTGDLEQGVYDLFASSDKFVQNENVDGMVNRFTEDGSLKLPGAPLFTGHNALRQNYAATFELEDFQVTQEIVSINISVAEDLSYVQSTFEVSFNTPGGPITDQGLSLMVLKRASDNNNKWKIAAEYLSPGPKP